MRASEEGVRSNLPRAAHTEHRSQGNAKLATTWVAEQIHTYTKNQWRIVAAIPSRAVQIFRHTQTSCLSYR